MGRYVVCAGQNLYDVALHVYGSIEGITDLLVCNGELSLSTCLKQGDELEYTDGYVIDQEVVLYNRMHGVVPANGERHVYVKVPSLPLLFMFWVKAEETGVKLILSGTGVLEVDWGDNSELQRVTLEGAECRFFHSFDSVVAERRCIRVYGELRLYGADLSGLRLSGVSLLAPLWVERLWLDDCGVPLSFVMLLRGLYEVRLRRCGSYSLLPLLACKGVMRLDLSGGVIRAAVLDEYLIGLVQQYEGRRCCEVLLSAAPSGEYREPGKDGNGNYVLTSGMEAVWVLTHEPAWNEAGHWRFVINERVYGYEQNGETDI